MNDATLSWQASATGMPTAYVVNWTYNGTAIAPQTIPATTAQNAAGYSIGFAASNPTITVAPGDVIGATVQADDVPDSLVSAVVASTPATVTEPAPPPPPPTPPGPPQNVTLTLA